MGYFVYFQLVKSEDFIDSPYNNRQDTFASRVVRGEILSSDGKILAQTNTDQQGNESRYYPYSNLYAHVVGFATNGKSGIESSMNFNLLRSHTFIGDRLVNELKSEKSMGDTVITTLNSSLQETAFNALGDYDGAVIVMEPSTGKVLAMVSKPDFDPNTIAKNWKSITSGDSAQSVLVNRATQGLYPPGSTFKIFTTLEYMHEDPNYAAFAFDCKGSTTADNTTIHCYDNESHGHEDLQAAFANSCNSAYATIGMTLDKAKFNGLCNSLLFNTTLQGDFATAKSSFSLPNNASTGLVMQTAIGQGQTLVTPLHMALMTCAIANNGVLMKPYVVDHTQNESGVVVKSFQPQAYSNTFLNKDETAVLQQFMQDVVQSGTGKKLKGASYTAAGKTGSAEFSNDKSESHSWFIGYAHRDDKTDIAVAVIAEGAGTGSTFAVPVAKQVFDAYYGQ
jgi:peptidoglycan glycosyltransferase